MTSSRGIDKPEYISLEDVKTVVSHPSRWILMTHLYRKGELLYSEAKNLLMKHGQSSSPWEIRRHLTELEKSGLVFHEERKPYIITPKGRRLIRGLFKLIEHRGDFWQKEF